MKRANCSLRRPCGRQRCVAAAPGTLTAIVGPNGAGKTTYFNLISGQLRASSGQVIVDGEDITGLAPPPAPSAVSDAPSSSPIFPAAQRAENVRLAVQSRADAGWSLLKVNTRRDLIEQAEAVLSACGWRTSGTSRRKPSRTVISASSSWPSHRHGANVFMFDEPTAGMSVDESRPCSNSSTTSGSARTRPCSRRAQDGRGALSLDRIIVLHNGALVADGDPAEVISSPVVQEAYLGVEVARD